MKGVLSILLVFFFAFTINSFSQDDPCNCTPKRGKVPYRLNAKTETHYENFHSKRKSITPETLFMWQAKYEARTKRDIDKNAERLKKTPEDSVYTLNGWMYKILKEIDCDYHIIIGGENPDDQKAEVEVTIENCELQKKIQAYLNSHNLRFNKEFAEPVKCKIKGLGFSDGQHGVKKLTGTAWELHPVKSLVFE